MEMENVSKFSNIELCFSQLIPRHPYAVTSTPLCRNSTIAKFQVPEKTVEKEKKTMGNLRKIESNRDEKEKLDTK